MKLRPLIIDDNARKIIQQMINHAKANPYSLKHVKRLVEGSESPPGDLDGFSCNLPVGYRVVYSIEVQPIGICHHISISVPMRMPNPEAVELILHEFGMPPLKVRKTWVEDGPRKSINVISLIGEKNEK